MAEKFKAPRFQQVNAAGAPVVGSLGFYITGTSTKINIYSNRALGASLSNPVNADSNGRFPAIWLDPDDLLVGVKVVYYADIDGGGATITTDDPYEDTPVTAASMGAASLTGDNSFTGANNHYGAETFTGPFTIKSIDPADAGQIDFQGDNSGGFPRDYARVKAVITDPTAASEDAKLSIETINAGTLAERAAVGEGMTIGSPTGGDPGFGILNAEGLQIDGNQVNARIFETARTASGTEEDFTIPAGVRKITAFLGGASIDNTTEILLQLGDSGGLETSGYAGGAVYATTGSSAGVNSTAGFLLSSGTVAATIHHVTAVLHLIDPATNTWACAMSGGLSNGPTALSGGGTKSLSGTLTQLRITTASGTASFDAGLINIAYE